MQVGFIKSEMAMKGGAMCVGVVENLLKKEEQAEAFKAFVDVMKKLLEEYETRMGRMISRVKPSKN